MGHHSNTAPLSSICFKNDIALIAVLKPLYTYCIDFFLQYWIKYSLNITQYHTFGSNYHTGSLISITFAFNIYIMMSSEHSNDWKRTQFL